MKNDNNKQVVCWGTGRIADRMLEHHPEVEPVFFIDKNREKKIYRDKNVFAPEEVENIRDYYVVILIKKYEEVSRYLEQKGLQRGTDYDVYYEALGTIPPIDVQKSIEQITEYKKKYISDIHPTLIAFYYGLSVRKPQIWYPFLNAHIKSHGNENYVVLIIGIGDYVSEEELNDLYSCKTFFFPNAISDDIKNAVNNLSDEDKAGLEEILSRKTYYAEQADSYSYGAWRMCYFEKVVDVLEPSKALILSGWNVNNYILKYVSEKKGVKFGVFEFGWIPGTIQVDPCGIIGQGECAQHPEIIKSIKVSDKDIEKVHEVEKYVLDSRTDSRDFVNSEADALQMKKIDGARKTVFVVGMNESGNATVNGSEYWKKVMSKAYDSMREALEACIDICRRRGWNLIFKPHPDDATFKDDESRYEDIAFIRDMPVDDLIEKSDVVVSMSSATEYRALMYDKPVVQVGITSLNHMDCTYVVNDGAELERMIESAINNGVTREQKRNFEILLARMMKKYLWDDLSERPVRYGLPVDVDFLEEQI